MHKLVPRGILDGMHQAMAGFDRKRGAVLLEFPPRRASEDTLKRKLQRFSIALTYG